MSRANIGLGVLVAVIWGMNFVVADIAVVALPPLLVVALRYAILGVCFLPFTSPRGLPWRHLVAVSLLSGVVQFGGLFLGLGAGVNPGVAAVVLQSQAFFTAVLAHRLLRERNSPRQWIGLAIGSCGLGGVALVEFQNVTALGILWVLAGGLGWAGANVVMKKAGAVSPWSMTVWQSVLVVPVLLVLSAVFEHGQIAALRGIGLDAVGALLYIALLATGAANVIWYTLIQRVGAAQTAPFSLLVPVVGVVASSLLLGEHLTAVQLGGATVTVLGLGLITLHRRPRPPSEPPPETAEAAAARSG